MPLAEVMSDPPRLDLGCGPQGDIDQDVPVTPTGTTWKKEAGPKARLCAEESLVNQKLAVALIV